MILIGGVLLLALIFWLIPFINQKRDSLQKEEQQGMLKIAVDGKQYGTYSLSKNRTIEINDTNICRNKGWKGDNDRSRLSGQVMYSSKSDFYKGRNNSVFAKQSGIGNREQ